MKIRFVLVCEGSSDAGLVPHLQGLCVRCGASEAIGNWPDMRRLREPPKNFSDRLSTAIGLEPSVNLVFAHRDADSADESRRIDEIATCAVGLQVQTVPVVPIRETEAWLLLNEAAIRAVVENPTGTACLNLPRPQDVERIPDPKRTLMNAFSLASGLKGRRLEELKKAFPRHRARLLERLDCDVLLSFVPAWQRLAQRTRDAVCRLKRESQQG